MNRFLVDRREEHIDETVNTVLIDDTDDSTVVPVGISAGAENQEGVDTIVDIEHSAVYSEVDMYRDLIDGLILSEIFSTDAALSPIELQMVQQSVDQQVSQEVMLPKEIDAQFYGRVRRIVQDKIVNVLRTLGKIAA